MSSGYRPIPLPGQQSQSTRPAELFRSDLISAMKLPDSHSLEPSSYVEIKEPWRTEWEIGVQVCVSPHSIPQLNVKLLTSTDEENVSNVKKTFELPSSLLPDEVEDQLSDEELLSRKYYEVDELDMAWIEAVNQKRKYRVLAGPNGLSGELLQQSITVLEKKCYHNMMKAVQTDESLRIEFDHSIVCDVCRDPDREESNEMVFCDSCNICVHQACYGIQSIPKGNWVCRTCAAQQREAPCVLCPIRSGARKRIKPGPGWTHMSCALWIPEVKIANVDKMEPVTNIDAIPISRWNLICCVCRKKEGACIQCSYPSCVAAYHITCGFRVGLEMKAHLDVEQGTVHHESYCPRHTTLRKTPSKLLSPNKDRPHDLTPLEQVEHEFFNYTTPQDLEKELDLSSQLSSLIFNYWKLKRKCHHNQPLLTGLHLNLSFQRLHSGLQYDIQTPLTDDEDFLNIIHIRHNLEKARNLMYMVQRRERVKRQLVNTTEQITQLELKVLEEKAKEVKSPPLCLKRLGLTTSTNNGHTIAPIALENGLYNNSKTDESSDPEIDTLSEARVLRKRTLRMSDSHSDDHTLMSPRQCRRLSEDGPLDKMMSSSSVATEKSRSTGGIVC